MVIQAQFLCLVNNSYIDLIIICEKYKHQTTTEHNLVKTTKYDSTKEYYSLVPRNHIKLIPQN